MGELVLQQRDSGERKEGSQFEASSSCGRRLSGGRKVARCCGDFGAAATCGGGPNDLEQARDAARRRLSRGRKVSMPRRLRATSWCGGDLQRRASRFGASSLCSANSVEAARSPCCVDGACEFRPSFRLPELRNNVQELGRDEGNCLCVLKLHEPYPNEKEDGLWRKI